MNMETKKGMLEYCNRICEKNNWILNKDEKTLHELIEGLVENKKKYSYQSCPCRLASGKRSLDRDLICPCDYALDNDVEEYGACYCNLYMRSNYYQTIGEPFVLVPEKRPIEKEKAVIEFFNQQK